MTQQDTPQTDTPQTDLAQALDGAGTWKVSRRGLRTMIRLELRQRVRSSRWKVALVLWALVLGVMTGLVHFALSSTTASESGPPRIGPTLFALVVYLVLSLGSLIAPGLSATSINGDRAAGVLATLQTTLLTPAEIVLGKLLAAWFTSLAFLAVALPFVAWGFSTGGTSVGRLVVTLALLMVMLLVVCAVGVGWSALTSRTASSVVLTYLTVAFMGVLLPVLFLLSLPVVTTNATITYNQRQYQSSTDAGQTWQCVRVTENRSVTHTEWTWWLLAANPYVVLADASPRPKSSTDDDLLTLVRLGVRMSRVGIDECLEPGRLYTERQGEAEDDRRREALGISWPYGLAINLGLGLGFTVGAIRRLRTPARVLPRWTRVA
jgi:ABC-type transport system involved in multi-copper enzyme maturation permease subunit